MLLLLSNPSKEWLKMDAEPGGRMVVSEFVYPLIGLCGLSEFIGTFIGRDFSNELFQIALTRCCEVAVSLFGGFFLAVYLLKRVNRQGDYKQLPAARVEEFVAGSMVVIFVLDIVSGLFSIELLYWILQLYTIYVVYEGARSFMQVPEKSLVGYTVVATCVVLLCPALVGYLFKQLSLILN